MVSLVEDCPRGGGPGDKPAITPPTPFRDCGTGAPRSIRTQLIAAAVYLVAASDPWSLTILLYKPRIKIVGVHCPIKFAFFSCPVAIITSDKPIAPRAAQRKVSEGNFAVCCSLGSVAHVQEYPAFDSFIN